MIHSATIRLPRSLSTNTACPGVGPSHIFFRRQRYAEYQMWKESDNYSRATRDDYSIKRDTPVNAVDVLGSNERRSKIASAPWGIKERSF